MMMITITAKKKHQNANTNNNNNNNKIISNFVTEPLRLLIFFLFVLFYFVKQEQKSQDLCFNDKIPFVFLYDIFVVVVEVVVFFL